MRPRPPTAQRGSFNGKVTETQLIDLLGQVAAVDDEVSVKRAKHHWDEDDELDLDSMDF